MMKLGIFDSGIGGRAVAESLRRAFPHAEIRVVDDKPNIPYGDKSGTEVINLTNTAIQPLILADCDIIVIACNTATAVAIETLREQYPQQLFIGIEPMLKPAASATKSGTICVCATPTTLLSERYLKLKQAFASQIKVIEPDCREWAYMIENDQLNQQLVKNTINEACEAGADVIVLGCTHYHWIKELIVGSAAGRAEVIDPSEAIAVRVKKLLAKQV